MTRFGEKERVPEPEETPAGPAFEGRLLDRPDDEVVDQGVRFDIRTLVTRRTMLGVVGAGLGAALLAACTPRSSASSAASSSDLPDGEIPDETAGPYPADGSNEVDGETVDVLEQSGIIRKDIRTNIDGGDPVEGVRLDFTFALTDMSNDDAPLVGAAVYAWMCNAEGLYSMYSEGVKDQTWLRGVQVTDDAGEVTFIGIVPACYTGRWTHIHFEVYPDADAITDASNAIAVSQMAFPQDMLDELYALDVYAGSARNLAQVSLETDNVFGDDGAELQMGAFTGSADAGYTSRLAVRVDPTTTPSAGSAPSGGPGGAPGGEPPSGEGAPPSAPPAGSGG